MAERNPAGGWTREWQAMQQQFLSAWRDAVGQSGSGGAVPLQEGLEFWSRLASGQTGHEDLTERMLAGTRQVVEMMQAALDASGAAGKAGSGLDVEEWRRAMAASLGAFGLDRNPVLDALRSATGDGAASFEQLAENARDAFGAIAGPARAWLSAPTFGLAREAQERQQRLARALTEQAESERAYQQLLLKASQLGLHKFEGKLAERDAPGRRVRSGRELYDLWIDAAEEGYAEVALSAEFRAAYAAMVDAQMRLRQSIQREVELFTGQFGMPTRSEVDSAHRRIADLTRRLAVLEEGSSQEAMPAAAAPVARARPLKAAPVTAKAGATRATTSSRPRAKPTPAPSRVAVRVPKPAKGSKAGKSSFAERLAQSRASAPKASRRSKGAKA